MKKHPAPQHSRSAQHYEGQWLQAVGHPVVEERKRILEVGFGHGERLLAYAFLFPQIDFYGIEHQTARFVKNQKLSAQHLSNVNLYFGEAEQLLNTLPQQFFDEIWVLHPDPWPKKRAHKNRLIQASTYECLLRLLKPQAVGLFLQTDHKEYAEWMIVEWQKLESSKQPHSEYVFRSLEVEAQGHNPALSIFHYEYKKLGQPVYRFEISNKEHAQPVFLANFFMPEVIYQEFPNAHRNPITLLSGN